MSTQERNKRNWRPNWRDTRREEAATRSREDRFAHLEQHFRNIGLSDGDEDDDLSLPGQVVANLSSQSFADPDDDWDNPKPVVDLRTLNFSLPGILCPFCRQNLMAQDVSGLLVCACTSNLKTKVPIHAIQRTIQDVVMQHNSACPSNQSPDYTMFKSRIVLTCDVCTLAVVVS